MEPTGKSVGAVYCTYEDSGFLAESVARIYPLMKCILFLLNRKMWRGGEYPDILTETFRTIITLPDPDKKLVVVWGAWDHENEQRNFGLKYLRQEGVEWCLVVDDDELYNRAQLEFVFEHRMIQEAQAAYLFNIQTYWKRRDLMVDMSMWAVPCLVSTKEGKIRFNENRMVVVYCDTWNALPPDDVVCHHMSYVRTDEKMLRKLQGFSHSSDGLIKWYEDVWLKWKEGEEIIGPGGVPWKFSENVKYRLERNLEEI
jgi:hypothetical protein